MFFEFHQSSRGNQWDNRARSDMSIHHGNKNICGFHRIKKEDKKLI